MSNRAFNLSSRCYELSSFLRGLQTNSSADLRRVGEARIFVAFSSAASGLSVTIEARVASFWSSPT